MKKIIGISLFAAFIGGAAAIGGYKMLESSQNSGTISERQNAFFANNGPMVSSAGAVDFVDAAALVSPAVVHIKTTFGAQSSRSEEMNLLEQMFGGRGMQRAPRAGSGSGVIITNDGYIATNNHVVDKASKIEVVLTDKRRVEAKVVGRDPNTDLALLKIEEKNLPFVKLGNSDAVQVGEWVLAIGFPLNLQTTVTAGIVSAKARNIGIINQSQNTPSIEDIQEYRRSGVMPEQKANSSIESFIQTDAAINPGNSGGALINASGELIGINSAIASNTGYNEGYGFAIPVNLAKKILDDFMKYGEVKRGFIGVTFAPVSEVDKDALKITEHSGLYVSSVVAGSGAERAGVKTGDIIKKVDGKVVNDSPDLQERVGVLSPGDKVTLTVLRDKELKNIAVTLRGEEKSAVVASNTSKSGALTVDKLGATFSPISEDLKSKFGVRNGVVVETVSKGKIFDSYGIEKGMVVTDVNGIQVNSPKDLEDALKKSTQDYISITAVPEKGSIYRFGVPNSSK